MLDTVVARAGAWRWAFGAALVFALFLALKPGDASADWFPQADKARHAAAFLVLWMIGARARLTPAWALALGLAAFGVGIEIAQGFTATRQPSMGDVLADVIGIALGWCLRRPEPMPRAVAVQADRVKPPAT